MADNFENLNNEEKAQIIKLWISQEEAKVIAAQDKIRDLRTLLIETDQHEGDVELMMEDSKEQNTEEILREKLCCAKTEVELIDLNIKELDAKAEVMEEKALKEICEAETKFKEISLRIEARKEPKLREQANLLEALEKLRIEEKVLTEALYVNSIEESLENIDNPVLEEPKDTKEPKEDGPTESLKTLEAKIKKTEYNLEELDYVLKEEEDSEYEMALRQLESYRSCLELTRTKTLEWRKEQEDKRCRALLRVYQLKEELDNKCVNKK